MVLNVDKEIKSNFKWQMIIRKKYLDRIRAGKKVNISEVGLKPLDEIISGDFINNPQWSYQEVIVPNCWERNGFLKVLCGPIWYRSSFKVERNWFSDKRLFFASVWSGKLFLCCPVKWSKDRGTSGNVG